MKYLPQVTKAKYAEGYLVTATFDDGTTKTIDISQWFKGPVFQPLRDKRFFKRFFLDGGTICWPNGADIAPETLYAAEESGGRINRRVQRTAKRGH